ncbi:MAG TPA: hypothetical protein VLM40_18795 [Gemmata sp.]|nr:hypothetical protein [Gemmata sp.]
MTTLEDAWAWYRAVGEAAKRLAHLGKYWDSFPWGCDEEWVKRLQKDNALRHLRTEELSKDATLIQEGLDDLAVLVLFSVFEASVRDVVSEQVRPEVEQLKHPSLKTAGAEVIQAVAEGSFFRILEPFKSPGTNDLVEQVNQVRRYRNWVAHGRRPEMKPDALVQPKEAYQRLKALLAVIRPPTPASS